MRFRPAAQPISGRYPASGYLQHAVRLRGRGLHVSVYAHYLKVFHLEAIRNSAKE